MKALHGNVIAKPGVVAAREADHALCKLKVPSHKLRMV